jgi:DNA-binding transcriptional regulator GbsR (MarR family)
MNTSKLEARKTRLIEKLGVQIEKEHQLAPVAARIFATLIMIGKKGCTFDQLVTDLKAGKSTVSTHLEHLQATNRIEYYTKAGDRKRYFIVKPDLMVNYIDEMTAKWEAERCIHQEVLEYKSQMNKLDSEENFDLEFQKSLLTFLNEATAAVNKLKKKITNS